MRGQNLPKPLVKALAVFLTLALTASSPGAASYAVAAEMIGASAKSAPANIGPTALPAINAPVSASLPGSLTTPTSLNGTLSGITSQVPSVISGAVLAAPRLGVPGVSAAPVGTEIPSSVAPQDVPAPNVNAIPNGVRAAAPAPVQEKPAVTALEQLQKAIQGAAPSREGKATETDAKTGGQAAFDGSAPAAVEASQPDLTHYIHEGFFGWRKVQGVKLDPALKPLPADADVSQVIDQISRQFGFSRAEVVALAAQYRLRPESPVADWFSVYDRLQKINREQFNILDHKKYEGWGSFRNLADRSYAAGWKGVLQRGLEFHKHFLGFFVRFPYHLFDTFIFGYFRQNIAFEFRHSTENFLDLKAPETKKDKSRITGVQNPEDDKRQTLKWLEESLRQYAFKGPGLLAGLKANPWVRGLQHYFITPVAEPLVNFVLRRLALAAASAVAMGVLGAFAPVLPLSFALTSIPVLGPALVAVAVGAPAFLGMVPVIGPFLAPIVTAAMTALTKDLVLGPLFNTLILSTMMTLPQSLKEKAFELRKINPTAPLGPLGYLRAFGQALVSGSFWRANLKSFLGMVTVGAEIEGVMGYAGSVDGLFDPALMRLSGHHFKVFESIGAAVERPKGESSIPFGGAITWGNILLVKLQDATGIQLSQWTMHAVQSLTGVFHDTAQNAALAGVSAQAAVGSASHRPDSTEYKFDPELYKQGPEAVAARVKELAGQAGHLQQEIVAVKDHMARLDAQLLAADGRVADLKRQSRPISAEEQAEYDRLLGELSGKRDEKYIQSKLSELHDLKNPQPEDLARLRELKKLQDDYNAILLPPPQGQDAMMADLAVKEASLKALSEHLASIAENRPMRTGDGAGGRLDEATLAKISGLVGDIEQLRGEAKGEMANRDAAQSLLAVANKSRNLALRDRRSGKEMLEFHKNLSRLATVMDLALSLNEISAAEAAIKQMMDLLDQKLAKISAAQAGNAQGTGQAADMKNQVSQWRSDLQKTVDGDDATKARIVTDEGKSTLAATRFQSYHDDTSALIARINGEDGGASGDAAKEYQRRIDLLPQVAAWRTNGNPSNPDAFSLKGLQDDLAQVSDYLQKAQDGISQLQTMPVEFAGVAIVAVPGPQVNVSNPSQAQVMQILADRQVYWQAQRAQYQKDLGTVTRYLDPNNSRTTVDEFGNTAPESLPRWRSQQATALSKSQSEAAQYLAQIDAMASQINSVAGANIPLLSGRSVDDLRTSIPGYGDKLRAVHFPTGSDPNIFVAEMNLVSIAKLIPYAAHDVIQWAQADSTIKAIDKATSTTLPTAKDKLAEVVAMLDAVLADVDADRAYMTNGGDGQALINRKIALLQVKVVPALRDAQIMLQQTMIPYQQSSIDSAKANGDLFSLFDAQRTLMNTVSDLYKNTLPWAMSTYGATQGDQAAAHASIADFRKTLQDNLNGYDDASGHNEGVKEYQAEVANRKDPNYTGTEVMYGETMPYSLPRKITQYTAERAQRAADINTQAAQINDILGKIQALSKGKYNLQSYLLPTGMTADKAGVARVQALVDNGSLRGLANQLQSIGSAASAASGDINMGLGSGGTVPSGTQPAITVSDQQQIALLSLEAAKRLVPSTAKAPDSAPCYYAVARFLFSDGIINASQDALQNQIPPAEAFLNRMAQALSNSIDDTAKDDAYAGSGGTSETPEQTYSRKVATFASLSAVLKAGEAFFDIKKGWDQASFATLDKVASYYSSLSDVYSGGAQVNASELQAEQQMRASLQKTYDSLEANRRKVTTWIGQLDDPHESALRRVNESISELQDKTRAVLETNIEYHKLSDQVTRSGTILQSVLGRIDDKQEQLKAELAKPELQGGLPPDLVNRIEDLRLGRGAWAFAGRDPRSTGALVVRKAEFGAFLDAVMGMFQAQSPGMDLSSIKAEMLKDPQSLASLIPNSAVMDFGDTADGFYLVYQTRFSVPNGLETSNWVTLGNIAQAWGNNISVSGYQFASPPNDVNAPYGDKGVEMQIESLQGKSWVNYLNVDLHRFALDVPQDMQIQSQAAQSRILVFDDFAMMMLGDRLYVGLAGFGDFAAENSAGSPAYYGGNLKSSLKLTEVMKLNFEQQELFAKDPRKFMQEVNLDFTGYDPDLNKDFLISASGDSKNYSRTQVGPSFDVGRLLNSKDQFTVDLFFASTSGTDDISQKSVGATILKGFTIRDSEGKARAQITNSLTGELGDQYDSVKERLSVTLPDYGVVVSGQGQLLGTAKSYYGEVAKKLGDRSTISVGYGSPYVGMNNRLAIQANTSFTLGQLWQAVVNNSGQDLKGGETLKKFNKDMDDFFRGEGDKGSAPTVAALRQVFEADVARQLVSQDIGQLTRDIHDLRKAGAVLDNTRMRGMVGFVTNPISNDLTDRAAGGGFVAGTYTELTMTKSQKALVAAKAESLYREGLRLQMRLVDLVKQWQASVTELAQAQWEIKMAEFSVQNSPSPAARAEAEVRRAQAVARLHEALVRYNLLSGRDPEAAAPFQNLNAADLESLLVEIRKTIAAPDRLSQILHSLDRSELEAKLGPDPVNVMDWIPVFEKISVGVGVQFQDMMANQILTAGASLRLPIYDPSSKERDHAYVLEQKATIQEMAQSYSDWRLQAAQEVQTARAWSVSADAVQPGLSKAADDLSLAIRAYRNGLIPASELRQAFASWHWYMSTVLEARSSAALADAWAVLDQGFVHQAAGGAGTLRIAQLDDAFSEISRNAHSLGEVALRAQAAAAMTEANNHRIEKAAVDLNIGTGLTATGINWLPTIGLTGFPVTPVLHFELKPEELRELQAAQGKGQTEYYRELKTRLEADLAVRFTQNLLAFQTALRSAGVLEREVIPQLESQLAAELARGVPGAADVPATSAARRLDEARGRLEQSRLAAGQAQATMNYLLGRPEGAALEIGLSGEQALASLDRILAAKDPVAAQKAVLASRVEVARAVETVVDKDLKVEQLSIEPVGMVVRSLGRLVKAIGSDSIGNPDLVAAARVQTLTEERAARSFDKDREVQIARARTELGAVQSRLDQSQGGDPASDYERATLQGRALALRASLAALGQPEGSARARAYADLPASFTELKSRLAEARQGLAARPPETPVELLQPELQEQRSSAFLRYYHARSTLDQSVRIDKDYAEGWIEVRLRSPDTPPETLVALAKLRQEKADRIYRNDLGASEAQASLLASRFETDVRLARWADRQLKTGAGGIGSSAGTGRTDSLTAGGSSELVKYAGELRERLLAEQGEMAALLDLDPHLDPQALLGRLMDMVPEDASGAQGLAALGDAFISQVRARQLDGVQRTLFEDGLPASLGDPDNLINQLRADTIAERMSYKGFTPVATFGVFRGQMVGGAFLEAPDPHSIEKGLTNVLSDALRKELVSTGRMKELSLHLSELMVKVQDGTRTIEARRKLIQAAEAEYRAKLGQGQLEEARLAQERLFVDWVDFSRSLTETKDSFIALVSELDALGLGRTTGLRAASRSLPSEMPELRKDPRGELLAYGAQRMLDPDFAARLDAILADLGPGVTPQMRERLARRAELYREAAADGEAVMIREFTPGERLRLLTLNDKEGKRLAVQAELSGLLDALGRLDPHSNPRWAQLEVFFREDLKVQTRSRGQQLDDEVAVETALRDAYWHAVPAPFAVEGAFQRMEKLQGELIAAKQALLESYLTDLSADPNHFVLKDVFLDRYLKAEEAYDAELIKTFDSAEVRADGALARGLDGVYDLRRSVARTADATRSGRGLRAMDALAMLEESRLAAERWRGAAPEEIDVTAAALQNLREMRDRWQHKDVQLAPLYSLTQNGPDGRRLWSVDGWLTAEQVADLRAKGSIEQRDGRLYLKDKGLEVLGGVDASEAAQDQAAAASKSNQEAIDLHGEMRHGDFVATSADGQPTALSVAEVFGPQGLAAQGRVFFFDARQDQDKAGALHQAAHPLTALARPPEQNEIYLYTGHAALDRGLFPTSESLKSSPQAKDFSRLLVTEKGSEALMTWWRDRGADQARRGWLEVKLNGYGFARDGQGKVSELYLNQDDFNAALKSFHNAGKDLRSARNELAEAQHSIAGLQKDVEAKKDVADRAGLDYQRAQSEVRAALRDAAYASVARQRGESDQLYEARCKSALDKAVSQDRDFKAAQKRFEPVAKASALAADKLKEAQAQVENKDKAVQQAEAILSNSRTWSLYRSADLELGLDGQGRVAEARAPPVYGALALGERLGGPAVRTVSGELLAAIVDGKGGVRAITDPGEFARAAQTWTLKSVAMGGTDEPASPSGRTVRPTYRLSHYEAVVAGRDGQKQALPVSLNRRYLAQCLGDAQSKAGHAKSWAVMPYNWGNILLEIPRGIVDAPVELITGRDPNQQHYLGRAYMYKTEGGETEHYGFFRKVANAIDVLDLLPDPVGRYYDPSQFPATVQVDSRILPGQNILDKKAGALRDGRQKDIHFGVKSAVRTADQTLQDLLAARERTLSRFQGGSEELLVEEVRGRNGTYLESRRTGSHGRESISEALKDPSVAQDSASDGIGLRDVTLAAEPGNLAVDRVERRIRITAGVGQYAAQKEALKGYADRLARQAADAAAKAPGLAAQLDEARKSLAEATGLRDRARGEEDALWQRCHELSWRIAAQRLLEAELARWEAEAADLRQQMSWWQGYLDRLHAVPQPQPGPDPSQPGNPYAQLWAWLAALSALAAVASAVIYWLRSRRLVQPA